MPDFFQQQRSEIVGAAWDANAYAAGQIALTF
jgi:hypothetical protein